MRVVRGHEYDGGRNVLGLQSLQHAKAIDLRHLDVEEKDIRPQRRNCVDSLLPAGASGDDVNARRREVGGQAFASEWLVVDNQCAEQRGRERGTGNGDRGTGNGERERGTGNGEQGTGNKVQPNIAARRERVFARPMPGGSSLGASGPGPSSSIVICSVPALRHAFT